MSDIICITNRVQCREDFLTRLSRIAAAKPRAIILREKDLDNTAYAALAQAAQERCAPHGVPLILNGHAALAHKMTLGVQLPYAQRHEADTTLSCRGVSVHSVDEAAALSSQPLTHIIAGHIWPTDCKAGVPPRGAAFLENVCRASAHPVYAIGGVTPERMPEVYRAGARGACIMSSIMTCPDPAALLEKFRQFTYEGELQNESL